MHQVRVTVHNIYIHPHKRTVVAHVLIKVYSGRWCCKSSNISSNISTSKLAVSNSDSAHTMIEQLSKLPCCSKTIVPHPTTPVCNVRFVVPTKLAPNLHHNTIKAFTLQMYMCTYTCTCRQWYGIGGTIPEHETCGM